MALQVTPVVAFYMLRDWPRAVARIDSWLPRRYAGVIREQARERGKQIEAEAKTQAEEESRRIVASGEKQLQASRAQVISELRSEIGQNSINLAEKLLGGELSSATKQSSTIDAFLSELDSVAPAGK